VLNQIGVYGIESECESVSGVYGISEMKMRQGERVRVSERGSMCFLLPNSAS
jgi:hypothetical protein